jgi:hypothetical protein
MVPKNKEEQKECIGFPSLPETVDFRHGNRSLPLKKGGQEGFVDESFEKIPLNPPFPKGEDHPILAAAHLSTLSTKEGRGEVSLTSRFIRSELPPLTPPSRETAQKMAPILTFPRCRKWQQGKGPKRVAGCIFMVRG